MVFMIVFIAFCIFWACYDVKKRKLVGIEKVKTCLAYMYFTISMSLFIFFASTNKAAIAIIIFLHLALIACVYRLKQRKSLYIVVDLILICIIGIILSICYILNWNFNNIILWIILGIGIYILPALGYIERRTNIVNKMKRCTKEVDAKIIEVIKSTEHSENGFARRIYIPKFEIELDGKKYEFMDSDEIYFRRKFKVGETMKLFINPDNPQFDIYNVSDNVFLPDPEKEHSFFINIVIWYASTTLIILMATILRLLEI